VARARSLTWLTAAFLAGAAIMMLEILAGRLMAPHYGHSIYLWGALIGVVLAALASGYAIGGRLGDRVPLPAAVYALLLAAAAFVAVLPWTASALLPATRGLGPRTGAIAGAVLVTALPCLALAALSPILVRRLARERLAAAAGNAYAVSTAGSIAGTFFAAFYAIPELGSRVSLLLTAAVIAFAALALAIGERRRRPAAFALLLLPLGAAAPGEMAAGTPVHRVESAYNLIEVVDRGDRRLLFLNDRNGYHSVMVKGALLTGVVHDHFLIAPLLPGSTATAGRMLFLGVAGGISIRQLAEVYPALKLTGVEIDPAVLDAARDHFGLTESERVELVAADARWFVTNDHTHYDVIAVDLFQDTSIPPACTTVEFFNQLAARLNPDGVLIMNVFARHDRDQLVGPLMHSVAQVFPGVFLYRPYNTFIIATKAPTDVETLRERLNPARAPIAAADIVRRAASGLTASQDHQRWPVFTDDRSDIEFRAFRAMHGG
jgi:spermidine synthase